ncbi:MAG: hypothetical protein LRS48_04725 [Desulfurococcales archaeon]|nr:hypothetical protein [Desulfurococcales archaeon]
MDRESVKREILSLIDDHYSGWVKAAFYSDPVVEPIVDRLMNTWESNGREGIPLDFASDEELTTLLSQARKYSRLDDSTARAIAMSRMGADEESSGSVWGVFSGLLGRVRRAFSRGRREDAL